MSNQVSRGARLRAAVIVLSFTLSLVAGAAEAGSSETRATAAASAAPRTVLAAPSSIGSVIGRIGTGLGGALSQINQGLGVAIGQLSQGLGTVVGHLDGSYIEPTAGTTSSEGYIASDGLARRFILVRPTVSIDDAPVLILLHAKGLSPERMANLTRAGRLAADYGVWVYLPEAELKNWNDDPQNLIGPDDVAFLRRLIDSVVTANKLDAKRVFMAGYSNGGFMAERAGCALSSRIAGLATVAATLRESVAADCPLGHNMPVAQFQGTSDLIVPYNGLPGLTSAPVSAAFWAQQSHCAAGQIQTSALPRTIHDDTSVSVTRYTGCPFGTGVSLYTIDHGGHTWPDSQDAVYTAELGRTTRDVDATLELWRFFSPYALQ